MLIRYMLAMIAGIWMADGVALLVAPRRRDRYAEDMLALSPNIRVWEGMAAVWVSVSLQNARPTI